MRRFPWDVVLALLVGLGLGLVYAWMIAPLRVTEAEPGTLRADFKDQYRAAIAAAYEADGNLPRARARLALLRDSNPIEALNAQAQRMLSQGESSQASSRVAALAQALAEGIGEFIPASQANPESAAAVTSTATLLSPSPEATSQLTETALPPQPTETETAASSSTPPQTDPPIPTLTIPFKLAGQDELCDPNLPEGLLQVIVVNGNRRQMPGMEVDITWEGGMERFFTGLKPELGNGYADFVMLPGVSYTVQLAAGGDAASGLTPPSCQSPDGKAFTGGYKLTFQRP